MAQVSKGSFVTNASEGRSLTFNWAVDSTNIEKNYKRIYWSLVGSGSYTYGYVYAGDFKVIVDGKVVYNSSARIPVYSGTVVASGYVDVYHNNDGTKTLNASVEASIYEMTIDNKGSGSWELPTIARYSKLADMDVTDITETSAIVRWETDRPRSITYYTLDDGVTWIGSATYGEAVASDGKSGYFNILNLSPNTLYKVRLKFRNADSGLWYEALIVWDFTTYNFPHCTSSPNFTIGDALTLDFYNPLGRSFTVKGYSRSDGREIFSGTSNGTRMVGFNDPNSMNEQYASIPNSQSSEYTVVVVYNDTPITRDTRNVYEIRGNEVPTLRDVSYYDSNSNTTAITGNNKHIVQNKSTLSVAISSATANYGAGSIVKYVITCNGKTWEKSNSGIHHLGTVDSERDVELTLTAIDSRGLSASKTINVTMLAYDNPDAVVTLQRLNNYEDETYLTVDGSVSSVNDKNTMEIKYRYKVLGGSYGSFVTIGDRVKQTFSLDKNSVYIFNVVVTDAFGSAYNREHPLGKGVFPLFIDTAKNSIGVNKLPVYEKSVEISGVFSLGEANSFELKAGESKDIYIFLNGVTGLINFRVAGANLEVAKLFYVFRPTQYFGIHKALFDESFNNTGAVIPFEVGNATDGYRFSIKNNHTSSVFVRYGILELC